jgi:integrase
MGQQYLFQRNGIWYVKTQGAKRVERSLFTSDRAQAVVNAAPAIQAHQRELAARQPRFEAAWVQRFEPRLAPYALPNGEQAVAGERELSIYDGAGKLLRTEPNGQNGHRFVGAPITVASMMTALNDAPAGMLGDLDEPAPLHVVRKSDDDAVLAAYLDLKNVTGYPRREAEATWALFRTLTKGKPFRQCTWDDGRALVAYYTAQGLKVASIHKRLVRLNAAVNFAIKTGKLTRDTINPFAAVVAKEGDDSTKKVALDDADLKACAANFGKLSPHDQLLFRTCCTMGLRVGEAYQIAGEQTLKGIRFCEVVSRKGKSAKLRPRRVPFPSHLLPHLPPVVNAPLFTGTSNNADHRLNDWLHDECGIGTKDETGRYDKTLHSLRHRAIELLREAGCPDNVSRRLFGHAKDEHEKYGDAIVILKEWADKIDGI